MARIVIALAAAALLATPALGDGRADRASILRHCHLNGDRHRLIECEQPDLPRACNAFFGRAQRC